MMRIITNAGHGLYLNVKDGVADKLTPDPYTYEGQLEKLQAHISLQSVVIAELINALCENGGIKSTQLEDILGFSYEVRLD